MDRVFAPEGAKAFGLVCCCAVGIWQPRHVRMRSAVRSLALRARGLRAISSAVGTTGFLVSRVSFRSLSSGSHAAGEEPGTDGPRPAHAAKARLMIRSSKE